MWQNLTFTLGMKLLPKFQRNDFVIKMLLSRHDIVVWSINFIPSPGIRPFQSEYRLYLTQNGNYITKANVNRLVRCYFLTFTLQKNAGKTQGDQDVRGGGTELIKLLPAFNRSAFKSYLGSSCYFGRLIGFYKFFNVVLVFIVIPGYDDINVGRFFILNK